MRIEYYLSRGRQSREYAQFSILTLVYLVVMRRIVALQRNSAIICRKDPGALWAQGRSRPGCPRGWRTFSARRRGGHCNQP